MGRTFFRVSLGLSGLLVLLAPTPFPGAMIGFLVAVAAAFFLVPLVVAVQSFAAQAGMEVPHAWIVAALAAGYGLLVLGLFAAAFRRWRRGDVDMARDRCARGVFFVALGLAAYLSSHALADAWRV